MKKKLKWTLFSTPLTLISALPLLAVSCGKSNENTNTLNNNETNTTGNETENNHTGTLDTNNSDENLNENETEEKTETNLKPTVEVDADNNQIITIHKKFVSFKPYSLFWDTNYLYGSENLDKTASIRIREVSGYNEMLERWKDEYDETPVVKEKLKKKNIELKDIEIPAFEFWKNKNAKKELVSNWEKNYKKIFNEYWFELSVNDAPSEETLDLQKIDSFKKIIQIFKTNWNEFLTLEKKEEFLKKYRIYFFTNDSITHKIMEYDSIWRKYNESSKLFSYYNFPYVVTEGANTYKFYRVFKLTNLQKINDTLLKFTFSLNKNYENEYVEKYGTKEVKSSILKLLPETNFSWYLDLKTETWIFSENDFEELEKINDFSEKPDEFWYETLSNILDIKYLGSKEEEQISKYNFETLKSKFEIKNIAKIFSSLENSKKYVLLKKFLETKFNFTLPDNFSQNIEKLTYNKNQKVFEILLKISDNTKIKILYSI
ncbi:hypothetical protein [Mycoplasmopsis columbinasalis]|uniref:Lipoprotein n=1 Tax=Mycoplasmopsis columbinasalis TaxID=114880 RepID=A0A449BB09_9BACT|nr:hypothetical protein [Mycoplasmopsis columbinasalis]VEU78389.1 Uncharacterised protein [Mycoplasmopsis columbinasalis]